MMRAQREANRRRVASRLLATSYPAVWNFDQTGGPLWDLLWVSSGRKGPSPLLRRLVRTTSAGRWMIGF